MCLMPRCRSPAMISRASGRGEACSSMAPASRSSALTKTIVWPARCACSKASAATAGNSIPSAFMNRALPTRTSLPAMPTVMP